MNDRDRERGILRDMEGDFMVALGEMQKVQKRELRRIHRWYRGLAVWLILVSVGLIGVLVGGLIVQGQQTAKVRQVQVDQQESRRRAVTDACVERNRLSGGLLFFLQNVQPRLVPQASFVFRQQPSCDMYADALLGNGEPPPTVPGHPERPTP